MANQPLPQHKDPTSDDRLAVAPYNFVPLPDQVLTVGLPPDQDVYQGHTGYFTCLIETCSPTYIRGMRLANDSKESKSNPEFFSLDGGKTPVLPGSSLRGLIRNLLEVVTYSKFEMAPKNPLVYRSVGDTTSHGLNYRKRIMHDDAKNTYTPLVKGGYMRQSNGQWFIQPATEIGGTTFCRIPIKKIPTNLSGWEACRNAKTIFATPGPYQYQDVRGGFLKIRYAKTLRANATMAPGLHKCALVYSGRMLQKNTEAIIFPPDEKIDQTKWWKIDHEMEMNYREQISKEQEALLGRQGALQEMQPVFYLVENDKLVFFGHTMMMRMTYRKSPHDLVPEHLRRESDVDMVEALFGYTKKVGEGKGKACSGRVFFSDATCTTRGDIFEAQIYPQILATPKPTTFQHYLIQPEPNDKTKLQDYDEGKTTLRGYKFYWHKGNLSIEQIREKDQKKLDEDHGKPDSKQQYSGIRPVKSDVQFQFTLRFENLSDEELGALSWLLQLGADSRYRFKLGMGKPLGMGAIALFPTLHLTDRTKRYQNLWNGSRWAEGEKDRETVKVIQTEAEKAFQNWVLAKPTINPQKATDIAKLGRIQNLLDLLSWPGPQTEGTRYMEIERRDTSSKTGKRNEYRERPVLPPPAAVKRLYPPKALPISTSPVAPVLPPQPKTTTSVAPPPPQTVKTKPTQEIADPKTADELKKGMYLYGKVVKIEPSRLIIDIGVAQGAVAKDKVSPPVPFLDEAYHIGQPVYVWYEGKNPKGNHQLTMKK